MSGACPTPENPGISRRARWQNLGSIADPDEVIPLRRELLQLPPPGGQGRPGQLDALAGALQARWERVGLIADLDEVIPLRRGLLQLHSPENQGRSGHPDACL
ncbi:hypothetical protein FA13DRAFT_1727108 [Coprinellus micaceus]|uniref:Uncharacterized protein n=1 Tax=Coprinellus micaceus TaxID=71717 RepID=A0A4Y7TRX9_COPMI|nr:hypothetical protein FA13DRAFT_1727108 [Coprinellus micaceus]